MTVPSLPDFPEFLQAHPALCERATALWLRLPTEKDPVTAERILAQLISNPQMKDVWDDIYRGRRDALGGGRYLNPACLTNKAQAAARRAKAKILHKIAEKKADKEPEFKEATLLEFENGH